MSKEKVKVERGEKHRTKYILVSLESQCEIGDLEDNLLIAMNEAIENDRRDVILNISGIPIRLKDPDIKTLSLLGTIAEMKNKNFSLLGARESVLNTIQNNGLDGIISNYKDREAYYESLKLNYMR